MQSLRPSHVLVLTAAFALSSAVARADLVTPDSVSLGRIPLGIVTSGGTFEVLPVVTNAYQGLGLVFPTQPDNGGVALSSLNGVSVWSPIGPALGITPPVDVFRYGEPLIGQFVSPGTLAPATVSSLSLEVMSGGMFWVSVKNAQGDWFAGEMLPTGTGPHGGELFTFNQPGIAGFEVQPIHAGASGLQDSPWGVSEVSFSPATAPEPGSLLLVGLGALGLTAQSGRRRLKQLIRVRRGSSL